MRFGYKRVEMTHKTLRETFLNQKDFTSHYHLIQISTEEYKKRDRDTYWWTHLTDTRTQFPIPQKPKYVKYVTSRGMGSSQLLDGITEHGQGTIGNKNGMGIRRTY